MSAGPTCGPCRSVGASIIALAATLRASKQSWSPPPWSSAAQHRIAREKRAGMAAELYLARAEQAAGGVALKVWRGRWRDAGRARAANIRAPARIKKTVGR